MFSHARSRPHSWGCHTDAYLAPSAQTTLSLSGWRHVALTFGAHEPNLRSDGRRTRSGTVVRAEGSQPMSIRGGSVPLCDLQAQYRPLQADIETVVGRVL